MEFKKFGSIIDALFMNCSCSSVTGYTAIVHKMLGKLCTLTEIEFVSRTLCSVRNADALLSNCNSSLQKLGTTFFGHSAVGYFIVENRGRRAH